MENILVVVLVAVLVVVIYFFLKARKNAKRKRKTSSTTSAAPGTTPTAPTGTAATPSSGTSQTKKVFGIIGNVLGTIILVAIVVTLIMFIASLFKGCGRSDDKKTTKIEKVGKTKTLYRFADYPNGKVTVYIGSDANFYPKGGKIKYKTSTGKILTDEPGTAHQNQPEPAGTFTFWADSPSAWGVEVWQ